MSAIKKVFFGMLLFAALAPRAAQKLMHFADHSSECVADTDDDFGCGPGSGATCGG
jgi:hypothetical protein